VPCFSQANEVAQDNSDENFLKTYSSNYIFDRKKQLITQSSIEEEDYFRPIEKIRITLGNGDQDNSGTGTPRVAFFTP
jgi:phosphate starvation-inducible protein PhoH